MKLRLQFTLAVCSVLLCAATVGAQWINVSPGRDYQKFTAAGPNNVFVTRMAVTNTNP